MKYLGSIQLMQQLIRHLHMPSEVTVLADLSHWEANGTVYKIISYKVKSNIIVNETALYQKPSKQLQVNTLGHKLIQ